MDMQYRNFGKLDWKPSALGFGCMRLPLVDGNPAGENIDENEAIRIIRHAIDGGVNYVDTAYFYHNGKSEIVVGKALRDGYREKVKLATKAPLWYIKSTGDYDKYLDEQLKKLQTEHIDFYLFHGLSARTWEFINNLNLLKEAEDAVKDGRIGHIGFSFHDNYNAFEKIINGYDNWSFCQIQYNYMDVENQAGSKGLKLAASKGIPVVIMEPLLGGKLANPPGEIRTLLNSSGKERTPADWALQWVWNQPEVSVVLSGMSSFDQVEENLKSASKSGVNTLSSEDIKIIDIAREKYKERTIIPCTGCSYCMPCPNNVEIPRNFKMYNEGFMYNEINSTRDAYLRFIDEKNRANACIKCRACEERCPQKIKISEWMPKVHEVMVEGKSY
jgi:uncharacterized protein